MRRREFITLFAGAATWPFAARAQQPAMPVIGFLSSVSPQPFASFVDAFRAGLHESGYLEGQNVAIEFRWAEGHYDKLGALAAELVSRRVQVITATGGIVAAQAAKAATTTIPIVFTSGFDPVALGLVASFNKPGGNLTGASFFAGELSSKRLDILHELAPSAASLALLINPRNPNTPRELADAENAARAIRQTARVLYVSDDAEFEKISALLANERPDALLVSSDPFLQARRDTVVALAARHAIPAMYNERAYVAAGGLVSYGASIAEGYRQAGIYVGKVLGGANPADLPIVQPTRFEPVINLNTARVLGVHVPDKLLALADEVIE